MKLKKIAVIILSGCMAAAALGSVTASATTEKYSAKGYSGTLSYYYEDRYRNGSERKWVSSATHQVIVWSSKIQLKNGGTNTGKGGYSSKATDWVESSAINYGTTTFYKVSKSGARSYLCTRTGR